MNTEEYYLDVALAVARKSTCLRKQYGAVLVKNSEIIATGFNGAPRGEPHCTHCTKLGHGKDLADYVSCPAVHAEMNAIISASRQEMLGSTLYLACWQTELNKEYVDAQPCEVCLRLIKNAGITQIVTRRGVLYSRDDQNILQKVSN